MRRFDAVLAGLLSAWTACALTTILTLPPRTSSLACVLCGWAGCITLKWIREAKA